MSKSKPDTWMPLVIGDYLKDTKRLSTEQHGAYLLLLMDYWVSGPPPDDDAVLAGIAGLELRAWKRHRPTLARYFKVGEGVWRHKRVDEELADWTDRKAKNSERASAAAQARWDREHAGDAPSTPPGNARRNAKRNARSNSQGVLASCPASTSGEVEGSKQPSTLSGRERDDARPDGASPPLAWVGPVGLAAAVVAKMGDEWAASWLFPCEWDEEGRALLAPRDFTVTQLERNVRRLLVDARVDQVRVKGRAA